ncbi:acyl-CoA carboxylase biotin carboxyl carrier protein subunit [Sabulicella rubraurantiaca]|uniref:acetyl-CoA carboxylase biotin carboxyl carrier protein subunit n=1 Tax=Sabulicella rubraurantiaca TaxID=2811429 RepID=UPI001A958775|nr:acetyl-CoA carboxylase biotin carboxyl carrier protein subunit [Sabulicella rubraurantiaca]
MAEGVTTIRAEIGAAVWKITAPAGTEVAEEEPVLILESMKMEIPVLAPHAGRVLELLVEEGQQVEEGQPLATLRR